MKATCTECAAEFTLAAGTEAGEIVICEDCGCELEVRKVDGMEATLELAPEADEDWGE
ncbi:MAG: lysine biosynthesis protein LysW [Candidatus Peregrinibacteria bacterium]|nr:lysine biosynthesis protein LysW [Candidatus Peregrinibacteria bacterium]